MWLGSRTLYIFRHPLALCRLFSTCFLAFLFGSIYWGLGSKRCGIIVPVPFQSSLSVGGKGRSALTFAHWKSTRIGLHKTMLLSSQGLRGLACHPKCRCTPAHPFLCLQGHCAGDPEHHREPTCYLLALTPETPVKRMLPWSHT